MDKNIENWRPTHLFNTKLTKLTKLTKWYVY